jgi:hypothetical protein
LVVQYRRRAGGRQGAGLTVCTTGTRALRDKSF